MALKLLCCRHTDDMIHKLESAGLGYHVKTDESEDRLGMKLCSCGYTIVKANLITFENYSCEKVRVTTDNTHYRHFFSRMWWLLRCFSTIIVWQIKVPMSYTSFRSYPITSSRVPCSCPAGKHAPLDMGFWSAETGHRETLHESNCPPLCEYLI